MPWRNWSSQSLAPKTTNSLHINCWLQLFAVLKDRRESMQKQFLHLFSSTLPLTVCTLSQINKTLHFLWKTEMMKMLSAITQDAHAVIWNTCIIYLPTREFNMSICLLVNSACSQFLHWPCLVFTTYRFNSNCVLSPTEHQQRSIGSSQHRGSCPGDICQDSAREKPPPQLSTPWPQAWAPTPGTEGN